MKTELELVIQHVQSEVDYLKSSFDRCISDWDFEGAYAFYKPLQITSRKLEARHGLKQRNYKKIKQLKDSIAGPDRMLSERKKQVDGLEEGLPKRYGADFLEACQDKITRAKGELDLLQSERPKVWIDDDKILKILEAIEKNEAATAEFELVKGQIFLHFTVRNGKGEFAFRTEGRANLPSFLGEAGRRVLSRQGFNMELLTKQVANYKELDKRQILEELAIIHFEVFEIFEADAQVKVQ